MLWVRGFYDLDSLDLEVKTTIDAALQNEVIQLFNNLKSPEFLRAEGLRQERFLSQGHPKQMIYCLLLFETAPQGNLLRVQTDNLEQPLDINERIKMELDRTAKLRTPAHYLELVASLYDDRRLEILMPLFLTIPLPSGPAKRQRKIHRAARTNFCDSPWTGPIRPVLRKRSSRAVVCMPLITSISKTTDARCRSGSHVALNEPCLHPFNARSRSLPSSSFAL